MKIDAADVVGWLLVTLFVVPVALILLIATWGLLFQIVRDVLR